VREWERREISEKYSRFDVLFGIREMREIEEREMCFIIKKTKISLC